MQSVMYTAICVRCGSPKQSSLEACSSCSFKPESIRDRAEGLLLSLEYTVQSNEYGNESLSKSREELTRIGDLIKKGQAYQFPAQELEGAEQQVRLLRSLTPKKVIRDLSIWLTPLILVLLFGVFMATRD